MKTRVITAGIIHNHDSRLVRDRFPAVFTLNAAVTPIPNITANNLSSYDDVL